MNALHPLTNAPIRPAGGFLGVMMAQVAIFLIIPLFMHHFYTYIALQSCFILMILSALYTLSHKFYMHLIGFILVLFLVVIGTIGVVQDSLKWMVWAYLFYCLYMGFAIVALSKKILSAPFVNTDIIFGSIIIYLLAGILWGKLYFIIDIIHPGSFHGLQVSQYHNSLRMSYFNQFDLIYFSYASLTTLGMGDIAPIHHLAKSLTVAEAMFGQLFVAIVIARMVGYWRKKSELA
jgi:hypothetical protein